MAQYKVVTTFQALEQLSEIEDYLSEYRSTESAEYVVDGLIDAIESLERMPTRHPLLRTVEKKQYTYRYAPKWAYKIVFRIEEDPPIVFVITIVHSKQNTSWLDDILI
ncbi:MAG: type II toxin-antitoxin system RelE/ParE family toxin [Bacteroidota bacterium]